MLPMHAAAQHSTGAAKLDHHLVVQQLLAAGAAVSAADAHGYTAIRSAAHEGHTTVVQQLLAAHASLSIQALANAAAAAAAAGHAELAVMLLQTLVAQDGPVPAAAIAVLAKQPVAAVGWGCGRLPKVRSERRRSRGPSCNSS